jgi:hypothetical protein
VRRGSSSFAATEAVADPPLLVHLEPLDNATLGEWQTWWFADFVVSPPIGTAEIPEPGRAPAGGRYPFQRDNLARRQLVADRFIARYVA